MGIQDEKINEMALLDVVPLTLGVKEGHERMEQIINRNTTMPVHKNKVFSTAADGQTTIAIEVYEGERPLVKDNHFLGRFELSGIPPARRGEPKITIDFDVDANGILTVTATEENSKKVNKLTINKQTSTLSREEVERMISESEKYKEEDDKLREKLDKKHEFETLISEVGRVLTDENISKKLSDEDKKKIEEIKNNQKYETMRNTSNFTKEDYESAKKEIEEAFYPIMSKIYQQTEQPPNQSNTQPHMEEPKESKSSGPKIEEVD
jgi:molecular chaperone DnaK (HSP70)